MFVIFGGLMTAYASDPGQKRTLLRIGTTSVRSPYGTKQSSASQYKRWKGLKYSGYIRSYNQYRDMPTRYSGPRQLINVNGLDVQAGNFTGYQEPLALFRLEGSPTARTSFKIEYMFDHQMVGTVREDSTGGYNGGTKLQGTYGIAGNNNRRYMPYRIFQFTGSASTKVGEFNLIAGGGVNWYRLSPFTLWNYEYRDDMFERYPWDPEQHAWNKYNVFYSSQNIARDSRWGNTATQGFIIEGKNLPKGFGFSYIYGKTDNSGGYQTYNTKIPKNLMAARLKKGLKGQEFGVNFFMQYGFVDGKAFNRIRQQIVTTDARLNFTNFKIFYELGLGQWQDGVVDKKSYEFLTGRKASGDSIAPTGRDFGWHKDPLKNNRCINVQFDIKKDWFNVPLTFQAFSIGKGVVNANSQVLNSANDHAIGNPTNVGSPYDITTLQGAVTDIGQMTNNRQGVYLKHEDGYGPLKLMLAYGINQEIENDTATNSNMISYWHQANPFTRSRFTYFQSFTGPYGRITSIFRRTYEKFTITDSTLGYKKSYNTLSAGLKYKLTLFNRELILSNFNIYNSVSDKLSFAKFNDDAFLRTFYEEAMIFYALHPKVTILGFGSLERVFGNERINIIDGNGVEVTGIVAISERGNFKTIDQTGHGYGFGVDYDFASKAGLYVRHRWFDHKDKNFVLDKFKGQETTVELKIFF